MHSVVLLRKLRNTDTETAQLLSGRGKVRPAGLTSPANSQYTPQTLPEPVSSTPLPPPVPRSGPGGLHAPHTQDGPPQRASVSPTSALLALQPKPPAYKAVMPFLSLDSSADSSAAWAPDLRLRKQDPECSAPRVAPVGLNLLQLQEPPALPPSYLPASTVPAARKLFPLLAGIPTIPKSQLQCPLSALLLIPPRPPLPSATHWCRICEWELLSRYLRALSATDSLPYVA